MLNGAFGLLMVMNRYRQKWAVIAVIELSSLSPAERKVLILPHSSCQIVMAAVATGAAFARI
jgi:hypothetical protein